VSVSTKQLLTALALILGFLAAGLFAYTSGPNRLLKAGLTEEVDGPPMLDAHICGYGEVEVRRRVGVWSQAQVAVYQGVHLGPDMLLPLAYTGFFFVLAVLTFRAAFPDRTVWPGLVVIPVLTLLADWGENTLISFVILPAGKDHLDPETIAWGSRVTVAKWVLFLLNLLVIASGLVVYGCGFCCKRVRHDRT
jgi:hypothetical protein